MTRTALAVSSLVLTAAVVVAAALATASSNMQRTAARPHAGGDPSIDPSALMRLAPRTLPVERYPGH